MKNINFYTHKTITHGKKLVESKLDSIPNKLIAQKLSFNSTIYNLIFFKTIAKQFYVFLWYGQLFKTSYNKSYI